MSPSWPFADSKATNELEQDNGNADRNISPTDARGARRHGGAPAARARERREVLRCAVRRGGEHAWLSALLFRCLKSYTHMFGRALQRAGAAVTGDPDYRPGDVTRRAVGAVAGGAAVVVEGVAHAAGASDYQFGDVSRALAGGVSEAGVVVGGATISFFENFLQAENHIRHELRVIDLGTLLLHVLHRRYNKYDCDV